MPLRLLVIIYYYIDFLIVIIKALNSNGKLGLLNICLYLVLRKLKTIYLTLFYIGLDTNNLLLNTLLILLAQY